MAEFTEHHRDLIRAEGGYRLINVKHDRGGQTYAGISRNANPNWPGWAIIDKGADDEDPVLVELADELYRMRYWRPIRGDDITDPDVAELLYSSAVLSGVRRAVSMAQQAVEVAVDGKMGPITLAAVNDCDPGLFEARFVLARINRYRGICNRDRSQVRFLRGWLNRSFHELETDL